MDPVSALARLTAFPLTLLALAASVVVLLVRRWRSIEADDGDRERLSSLKPSWWNLPFFVWAFEGTVYVRETTWSGAMGLVNPPFEYYLEHLVCASAPLPLLFVVLTPLIMFSSDACAPWDRCGPKRTAVVATIASFFLNAQAILFLLRPWPSGYW